MRSIKHRDQLPGEMRGHGDRDRLDSMKVMVCVLTVGLGMEQCSGDKVKAHGYIMHGDRALHGSLHGELREGDRALRGTTWRSP